MKMKKNTLICFVLMTAFNFFALTACAQSKISKVFCPELQDTLAIERPEKGGAKVYLVKNGLSSFDEYEKAAKRYTSETAKERHCIGQAALKAYKEAGGQEKLRSIIFEKYGVTYGGGMIVIFSNKGCIDFISMTSSVTNWGDEEKYSDELLISIFCDLRKAFVFPMWQGSIVGYQSIMLVI